MFKSETLNSETLPNEDCNRCKIFILGSKDLIFLKTLLGVLRQGINSSISLALSVIDPEVVL